MQWYSPETINKHYAGAGVEEIAKKMRRVIYLTDHVNQPSFINYFEIK